MIKLYKLEKDAENLFNKAVPYFWKTSLMKKVLETLLELTLGRTNLYEYDGASILKDFLRIGKGISIDLYRVLGKKNSYGKEDFQGNY